MNSLVPDELMGTYNMLCCAFPEGLHEDDYPALLKLLYEGMSLRRVADIMSVFDRPKYDWQYVYHDLLSVLHDEQLSEVALDRVRRTLQACGYDEWLLEV